MVRVPVDCTCIVMKILMVFSCVLLMGMAVTTSAKALASCPDEKVDVEKNQTIDELASGPEYDESNGGNKRVKRYENNYDGSFHFKCPSHESISRIRSRHHNRHEDRQFAFNCKKTFQYNPICSGGYWVNNFDQSFAHICPNDGVIAGISSYHDNHHEDRRFAFKCCKSQFYQKLKGCYWTGYVNSFDKYIDWQPSHGYYLAGVSSYHDDHHEDRRFKFYVCNMVLRYCT
ncbi:hemagglutinin/amebocyte aggregation factor-like [Sardina pilchardus]|uniref:hemagglutinin/amebocyte aggregation factor-like n=1 Tax=Sardina pilchardus TaxID=27697 RepID=UPI002E11630C